MSEGFGQDRDERVAPSSQEEERVLEAVRQAIRDIEYGSVLVKIHQGGVVGIETSTKLRFSGQPQHP